MDAKEALKIVGDWICEETRKRSYKTEELKKLSSALIILKEEIEEKYRINY